MASIPRPQSAGLSDGEFDDLGDQPGSRPPSTRPGPVTTTQDVIGLVSCSFLCSFTVRH